MAPPLAERAETSASLRPSPSSLVRGLGAVGPVILMILLLLLCFPFKRKKRQLSTRTLKRDLNTSELISMTKLEGGLSPEEKSQQDGKLNKAGSALPNHQAERETNGFAGEIQEGNLNSLMDVHTAGLNHQRPEKSRKLDLDHLGGGLVPPVPCPKATSPNSLQFRKLPMTPKEIHISRMKSLNQSADSQVYESIRVEDVESCPSDQLEGSEGSRLPTDTSSSCATAQDLLARSGESGGKDTRAVGPNCRPSQMAPPLQCNESHGEGQAMVTPGRDAPLPVAFDTENRLSTMYARVCKRPKASQQLQPENHDKPAEREEEGPPPIPEKRFENIYESLSISTETQVGEIPELVSPPDA